LKKLITKKGWWSDSRYCPHNNNNNNNNKTGPVASGSHLQSWLLERLRSGGSLFKAGLGK
jgi:hypothetical protein